MDKQDRLKNFEGRKDQDIFCADQSMRRPGFALQHYCAEEKKATVVRVSNINNRYARKTHPQILGEIAHEIHSYLKDYPDAILVREEALYKATKGTIKTVAILHKVVGVCDLYGWASGNKEFNEISPRTVKRIITGNANAEKEEVAAGQEKYVGKIDYECDDESDAVAVGITWLIKKKYIEKIKPDVPIIDGGGQENDATNAT